MNKYIKPSGNQNRLAVLESIAQKGAQDASEGITYLRANTLAQVTALVPLYAAAIETAHNAKAAQATAVAAANTAVTAVSQYTRDIWAAVKRRTTRDKLPVAVQKYYGLTLAGKPPKISRQAIWLIVADSVIQGEAAAVAAGYPALATVTAAQLQIRLNAARTATSQRMAAKSSYDHSAAVLRTLGQQADSLIDTAMHELRSALWTETASFRREVMRGYGARFSEAEVIEEAAGDVPAVAEEIEVENLAAPAAMSMLQPYAVSAVNGNGTAVRV